ncbi:MAG: hypothetical protein LBQ81_09660 [Zoogloeaceae bacterium]|jgi:hypothetical protein|nr:hypothetical protein [Zoogloeaceae bacterium]
MNCQTCTHYSDANPPPRPPGDYGFCNAAPSFRQPVLADGARAPIDNTHLIHGGHACYFDPSRFRRHHE